MSRILTSLALVVVLAGSASAAPWTYKGLGPNDITPHGVFDQR